MTGQAHIDNMTGKHDVFIGRLDTGADLKLTVYAGGLLEASSRPTPDQSWSKGEFLGAAPLTPAVAEDGEADATAGPRPLMITAAGWVHVALVAPDAPGRCSGWNGMHDCGRPDDHPSDHVCIGCHDQWNRGEWDDEEDEGGFFEAQRPDYEDRCIAEVTC